MHESISRFVLVTTLADDGDAVASERSTEKAILRKIVSKTNNESDKSFSIF